MFNSVRRGFLAVTRLIPFYAHDVGDFAAGGNANVQQFLDARRPYRGNVANVGVRDAIDPVTLTAGDWVLVEAVGGQPRIDVWNGTAWKPLRFTVEPQIQTSFPYTLPSSVEELVCVNAVTDVSDVTLTGTPFIGQRHTIKDGKGDANVRRVRVYPAGLDLIDGEPYVDLLAEYMSVTLTWNGFQWNLL